ncbi:MAG: putative ABC transporter permease [Gemmiger formicilis]
MVRCRWARRRLSARRASADWSWPSAQSAAASLHTAVWDYADEWGNLAGLVCPKYTAYWFLLCGWVIFVLRGVESTVYHPQKSASRH